MKLKHYTKYNYAICPDCGRGVGISVNGILRPHFYGKSRRKCQSSSLHFQKSYRKYFQKI